MIQPNYFRVNGEQLSTHAQMLPVWEIKHRAGLDPNERLFIHDYGDEPDIELKHLDIVPVNGLWCFTKLTHRERRLGWEAANALEKEMEEHAGQPAFSRPGLVKSHH